jgi:hypothetical protein
MKKETRGNYKQKVNLALEAFLLVAITGAFLRSLTFIGYGVDPHHDYYSAAPGIFFHYGLRPNLDFYTHYGPADALAKGLLFDIIGPKLINLRAATWALELISLLLVCYGCELKAQSRCWLLSAIGIWAISEPSGTGLRGTLFWHHMGWSSDTAITLISLLIVATYWGYKARISPKNSSKILLYNGIRGALITFIFFTKFTIGLSMAAAVVASEIVYWRFAKPEVFLVVEDQVTKGSRTSKILAVSFSILFGIFTASLLFVYSMGGLEGLNGFAQQAIKGNYESFSAGSPLTSLIIGLERITLNLYTVFGCLIVIAIGSKASRLAKAGLLALALAILIELQGVNILNLTRGNASYPTHIFLLAYPIAMLIIAYAAVAIFWNYKRRSIQGAWSNKDIYCLCVLPVGLFSLSQFFPVSDPWHAWWSIGSALPAAAFITENWIEKRAPGSNNYLLTWIASFNLLALTLSTHILKTDIERYRYFLMASPDSNSDFFRGIYTVDKRAASVAESLRKLQQTTPNLIILDAGWGSLFELFASSDALRARAKCKIRPLQIVREPEYPQLLKCLHGLKRDGWNIIVTNNTNPTTMRPAFAKQLLITGAVVSQGEEPGLIDTAAKFGIRFSPRTKGEMKYWELEMN